MPWYRVADVTISWITGEHIEDNWRPYPCQFCRHNPIPPGGSVLCAQCKEDLSTPAIPAGEVRRCPSTSGEESECRKCFEDPEVLRLSRTGGWQGHCEYWKQTRRLDGTKDREGILEDGLSHEPVHLRRTARYLRRCFTRLGIHAIHVNDEVYDLLITPGGEPKHLPKAQREALSQLRRSRGVLTRADALEVLSSPATQNGEQ